MNIGTVARESGVPTRMIRYYESIHLIRSAGRTEAGYRIYSKSDVQVLRFIKRARNLGFSIEGISELLRLRNDRTRTSLEIRNLALTHIDDLNLRISYARWMIQMLEALLGD